MGVLGLDHVQLAAPRGCEEAARYFFGELLGLPEIPKPDAVRGRGGVWFRLGEQQLHVGVEEPFSPASKAHPALCVAPGRLEALAERLHAAGATVRWDEALGGRRRFYTDDPWGNRIELLAGERDPGDEAATAQRLLDEIGKFNVEATGIAGSHEVLRVERDDTGKLAGGVHGWTWGGTCWIEALWVREDMRRVGVGSRLLAAAEVEACRHGCRQLALETHTFQAPRFYERHGFEVVGALDDYPQGHAKLLLRKPLRS